MKKHVKAVVCDFDGTFSTLRCGWEAVMKRMMLTKHVMPYGITSMKS